MKLIDDARNWYKMFSVQALVFIGAVQGAAALIPADKMMAHVPFTAATTWNDMVVFCTIAGAVIGVLARLIDQPSVAE